MITVTELRRNIYKLLDEVARSGEPLEIKRGDTILKVIAEGAESKLSKLKKKAIINGDPESIVSSEWADEWKPSI